jgi:4-hydroxy-tetrahydrodipicolinate reductase
VARQATNRPGIRIVGAVDLDPLKIGRDLGDVIGLDRRARVPVGRDLKRAIMTSKPDVALHCTSSSLPKVTPQIESIVCMKVPVVSTTEELSFPWRTQQRLAGRIDAAARKGRVAVLGTGVNPGFIMDVLPVVLTGVCERVDRIIVNRIQDAGLRRLPFQQKIGAGLTREAFAARAQSGTVRHVGLAESISMIAAAMGWKLDQITDEISPRMADTRVSSEHLTVEAGLVCGIVQSGIGYRGEDPIVRLHMEAYLGAPESYESIDIMGHPNLSMRIPGGVHGDIATASMVVNSIPKVLAAPPGLHTMLSLPIPSWFERAR